MKTLYVENRDEWRSWLEANSQRASEVWLVYYKKDSGRPRVAYGDAVEEAICFGWVDSKIRKLDEKRFAQLFTPRNPRSKWSPSNVARAERMIREGKMTEAGSQVFDPRNQTPALPTRLPAPLETQFKRHETAWKNFQHFPPAYQRMTVGWVASAKKEETQLRRLSQLITESAANRRIKFM
jgi:uncharacterized protein YdeI (YjbR/CyaY-like superfamily)